MGVRGVIFEFQEWLLPLKCILEAFGTGVPARKVTVNIYIEFSLRIRGVNRSRHFLGKYNRTVIAKMLQFN